MVKFYYPDGTYCFRALHSVHAIYRDDDDRLVTRVNTPDGGFKTIEIAAFEILEAGKKLS